MNTVYFKTAGEHNTDETLKLSLNCAKSRGIWHIIIATTTGKTALKAVKIFDPKEFNLVIVSHMTGFRRPGVQELDEKIREQLIQAGAKVLTTTHVLSGIERAIRYKFDTIGPTELIAYTLRLFGQGTKVCVEITVMAADAGLIPLDEDVIAIGGTSSGADTAAIIRPAHSNNFFDLKIRELICKPSDF